MRDSNPRGREPNPLSNPGEALTCVCAAALPLVSRSEECVNAHSRTSAVETPIETRDCCRSNGARGGVPVPQRTRDHLLAKGRRRSALTPRAGSWPLLQSDRRPASGRGWRAGSHRGEALLCTFPMVDKFERHGAASRGDPERRNLLNPRQFDRSVEGRFDGYVVLVHGAWAGGWIWKKIIPSLRAVGHDVYATTGSGLAIASTSRAPRWTSALTSPTSSTRLSGRI